MSCHCDYILDREQVDEAHYSACGSQNLGRRNPDGTLKLNNHHLQMDVDVLYHLGLDTKSYDLPGLFGDVKFVCLGGTKTRMREMALYVTELLGSKQENLPNLTKHSHRYAMYKIGPVLCVSHGIGIPSMATCLQEVIKLMYYAKAHDPIFLRIGTSGGVAVTPGSVVISSWGLSGTLKKSYEVPVLGKIRETSSVLDKRLSQELFFLSKDITEFKTYIGGTLSADDFYRGQARLDGPFCDYTEQDKMSFLLTLAGMGVKNIEMEATAFAALTREAGIRAGIVCVTFLDRLHGDQVTPSKETLTEWQKRPMFVVGNLITKYLEKNKGIKH